MDEPSAPERYALFPLTVFDRLFERTTFVTGWLVEGTIESVALSAALHRVTRKWRMLSGRLQSVKEQEVSCRPAGPCAFMHFEPQCRHRKFNGSSRFPSAKSPWTIPHLHSQQPLPAYLSLIMSPYPYHPLLTPSLHLSFSTLRRLGNTLDGKAPITPSPVGTSLIFPRQRITVWLIPA